MKKLALVLLLLFTSNSYAYESGDSYVGVQLGQTDIEDLDLNYYLIRIGVEVYDHIDLELRSARGSNDEEDQGIEVEIERISGIYGLYHLTMGHASVYGIAGWSEGTIKTTINDQSTQVEEDSFSYGVGLQYRGVNVEWIQYVDTSNIEFDAVSIGYNYRFE
jgi:hypothetical protein